VQLTYQKYSNMASDFAVT